MNYAPHSCAWLNLPSSNQATSWAWKRIFSCVLITLVKRLKKQQCGVNILVYGSPGTGKTQFVKVISELTQLELLEVPSQEYNHEPIDGIKRLQYAQQTSRIHRTKPFMFTF